MSKCLFIEDKYKGMHIRAIIVILFKLCEVIQ